MNTKQVVIGIDFGVKGALTAIDATNNSVLFSFNLPLCNVWNHEVVDVALFHEMLKTNLTAIKVKIEDTYLFVERVNSFAQGNVSAFEFGANSLGFLGYLLTLGFVKINSITSPVWKRKLNLLNATKEDSVNLYNKIFYKFPLSLIKSSTRTKNARHQNDLTIGRAEATLIAYCGAMSLGFEMPQPQSLKLEEVGKPLEPKIERRGTYKRKPKGKPKEKELVV